MIWFRSVYRSGWVKFVPDSDSTWNFQVGENGTQNRLGMLVGSSGLGLVGFRLYRRVLGWIAGNVILAESVEI